MNKNRVRLDAITTGTPINRYLTLWHWKKYDDSGLPGHERIIKEKHGFNVEKENIKRDLKRLIKEPRQVLPKLAPQLAYAIGALFLALKGDYLSASAFAFTGAVAFDSTDSVGGDTSATTRTVNHAASGANRMAVLVAAKTYTSTFSNAIHDSTGGSNAMTEAGQTSVTDDPNVGIFYYANPSTSSVTYSCTVSAADYWGFVIYSFTGCSGTVDGYQDDTKAFAAQPVTVTITTTSGDMVVGGGGNDAGRDLTGGAGQTDVDIPTTGGKTTTSYKAADDVSEVFSYTWPTNGDSSCAAVRVQQVAAAGGGATIPHRTMLMGIGA